MISKLRKDETGFSVVEVVLVLVIVALIGAVGFLVYKNQHKITTASVATATKSTTTSAKTTMLAPKDSTVDWIAYSGIDGKITVKYPTTWVTASHPDLCSSGILLLGANSSSVGKCGSEDFGQVSITWQPSHADCGDLNSDAWTVNSKETVTVSGVSGLKQTATAKAPGVGLGTEPEGTKIVNYCFNSGGYTYVANYTKLASYPDSLSDFNTMVTETLKFSN